MFRYKIILIILIGICIDGYDFFIIMLAGYFFTALHILKICIPIRYCTDGRLYIQYFLPQLGVLVLDRFVSLRLAKSTIFTYPIHLDIKTVITRIATLSHDPSSIRTPYIQDIINQILIILHLVILFHQRMWPRSGRG